MLDVKPKRAFKGIWIPRELWLAEDLTLQEKVFLAEIDSLDKGKGCYASNRYFAKFFGLSKKRVSFIINSLCQKGRIKSEIDTEAGNKRTLRLYPRKEGDPIPENGDTPIPENRASYKTDNTLKNIDDNNKDLSSPNLSSADAQDRGYQLLTQYGVNPKVARAIVYEQHTPLESIEEAIKNGLAKQEYEKDFVVDAGYIVAALNGARAEGKLVGPTKSSQRLRESIDALTKSEKWKPPSGAEFATRKRRSLKQLRKREKQEAVPNVA